MSSFLAFLLFFGIPLLVVAGIFLYLGVTDVFRKGKASEPCGKCDGCKNDGTFYP